MAKTKREYILATCFLSGAAAIISLVALGTQEWVNSSVRAEGGTFGEGNLIRFGLFGGIFRQNSYILATFELTTVCLLDKSICALLCGDNLSKNLERLYNGNEIPSNEISACVSVQNVRNLQMGRNYFSPFFDAAEKSSENLYFFNAGIWICTILFLVLSSIMGIISAGLAVYNTASNPIQPYLSVFGMYIYNGIAFFFVLLVIALWGGMFSQDIINNDIPTYKVFLENFSTKGHATLGYSYWINFASLVLYLISLCLLYIRNYLISKEPNVNIQIEDSADPVIYLY